MPDYRCPSCRGGFPAAAAIDDACPWCGEPMDGADDSPLTPSAPVPSGTAPPIDNLPDMSPLDERDPFDERDRDLPTILPFWDSGIRCDDADSPLDDDTEDGPLGGVGQPDIDLPPSTNLSGTPRMDRAARRLNDDGGDA